MTIVCACFPAPVIENIRRELNMKKVEQHHVSNKFSSDNFDAFEIYLLPKKMFSPFPRKCFQSFPAPRWMLGFKCSEFWNSLKQVGLSHILEEVGTAGTYFTFLLSMIKDFFLVKLSTWWHFFTFRGGLNCQFLFGSLSPFLSSVQRRGTLKIRSHENSKRRRWRKGK